MRLVKQSSKILEPTTSLKAIERAARVCYKSEDKITEDESSAIQLVNNLVKREHHAMLEFGNDVHIKISVSTFERHILKTLLFTSLLKFIAVKYADSTYFLSFNPRTALNIIEEINTPLITFHEQRLLASIVAQLPKELVPQINSNFFENFNKYLFERFEPHSDNQKTVTVHLITNRGVSHELVRHKFCVAI